MNITDLQTLLHSEAEAVADQGAPARGSQIEHRIGVVRRRRAAGVVAGLVLAIAGTGAAITALPSKDSAGPVGDPKLTIYAPEEAGRELLGSVVSELGAAEARVTLTVDTGQLVLNTACYAEGPDTHFEMRVNGQYAGGGECTPGEPPARLHAVGFSSVPGPGSPWKDVTSAGGPFNLEIYTTQGDRGPRVTDDTARLMAGVYRLPEPLDVVQGNAVYGQEYFEGRTWEFESIGESPDNVRRWESSAGGVPDEDRVAMVWVEGTGVATVSANGQEWVAMSSGGGTTLEVPLADDGRRSVEVEITKGTAVRVVVAWYRPAG